MRADIQTDRRMDMTKLLVVSRNYAKAPQIKMVDFPVARVCVCVCVCVCCVYPRLSEESVWRHVPPSTHLSEISRV